MHHYAQIMAAPEPRRHIGEPGAVVAALAFWNRILPPGAVLAAQYAVTRALGVHNPLTEEDLADMVAQDLRAGELVKDLAEKYAPHMVRFGRLRSESADATVRRRFQEFLAARVWDVRIPVDEQNGHVRAGRRGGRPRAPQSEA